jgi:hypothetical protein
MSLDDSVVAFLRETGKLYAERIGVDTVGAHDRADQRIVQHVIERKFIMAKSHLLSFSC